MKYILRTLELLDNLNLFFKCDVDLKNKYSKSVENLSLIYNSLVENSNFSLSNYREKVLDYLNDLNIQHGKEMVAKSLNPNIPFENLEKEYIKTLQYKDLSDRLLFKCVINVFRTVSYIQKDNLLLLKYSKNIYNTGWHNFAKECRGKVIDLNTLKVVSFAFDKFFNLNEVPETDINVVKELLRKAKSILVTDKKDGSAIIVTNYKGDIIVNTNGEFNNKQVQLAKELFKEKYFDFYTHIPEGFTFIFELIHPENRIVLDYGEEKVLYLLAIRNLKSLRFVSYDKMCLFAKKFNLSVTESFNFINLDEFVQIAQNYREARIKEGWVFRIVLKDSDFLFKLKFQQYFELARISAIPSLRRIYILLMLDKYDDAISLAPDGIRCELEKKVEIIRRYIERAKDIVLMITENELKKYRITNIEDISINNQILSNISKDLKGNPLGTYIMRYLRFGSIDTLFEKYPTSQAFEKIYYYINDLDNITEDLWSIKEYEDAINEDNI